MGKTKYSNALKMRVVQYCIEGNHSYIDAARHFNINSKTSVMKWGRKYKALKKATQDLEDGKGIEHEII